MALKRLCGMHREGERQAPDEVHDSPQQTPDAKLTQLADGVPGENLSARVVSEDLMEVIAAFEQDGKGQGGDCADEQALGEGQSGGADDGVVVADASYSEDDAYNCAKAYECDQRKENFADDAEDDADFTDLFELGLNFGLHGDSFVYLSMTSLIILGRNRLSI